MKEPRRRNPEEETQKKKPRRRNPEEENHDQGTPFS
jgi:hypothetical protein